MAALADLGSGAHRIVAMIADVDVETDLLAITVRSHAFRADVVEPLVL
jgi:hypothetical protein